VSGDPVADLLGRLLDGSLTPREAAQALLAASGTTGAGLALDPAGLAPEGRARLEALMPALRWEMARLLVPGQVPDVDYDSPAYHAWIAAAPAVRRDQRGVSRFLPPDPPEESP